MIFDSLLSIVNKFIPDEDEARKAAVQLESEYTRQMEMQSDIIQAEIKNGSGLWRVRLMYLCMFLVAAHWIMYDLIPYIIVLGDFNLITPYEANMSDELWSFLKIGVGGYITSRGVEKSVAWWKK
jgi:hypothetical protein